MKKFTFVVSLVLFSLSLLAQSPAENLFENCVVVKNAMQIIRKSSSDSYSNMTMSEYTEDMGKDEFMITNSMIYEWGHADVPLSHVANNTWLLISKQLEGENGLLSTTHRNYISTRDENGHYMMVFIIWGSIGKKWVIACCRPTIITKIPRGTRSFDLGKKE